MMKKQNLMKLILLLPMGSLLAASAILAAPVSTPEPAVQQAMPVMAPKPVQLVKKATRVWNLQDADILAVIDEVSRDTNKSFIIDPRVSGKISIVSSQPMDNQELYQVFLAALAVQGFSVSPVEKNVFKILPSQDAQGDAAVGRNGNPDATQNIVVEVVPIENVSAQQLVPILRPLLPPWAVMSAYAPSNVLIISGSQSNVNNILDIIKKVDVASDQQYEIIALHNATAKDVTSTLNSLMDAVRMTGQPELISIAPDNRTNSLIVSGDIKQRMRIRILVSELDSKNPTEDAGNNVNVIYLHYLNAVEFAPVLARVAQANIALSGGKNASEISALAATGGGGAISSTVTSTGSSDNSSSSGSDSNTDSSLAAATAAAASSSPMIQPEIDSNALIITAPPALLHTLKSIIAQLDVHPSQVLVEAAIVELSDSDLQKLGIQYGSVQSANSSSSSEESTSTPTFQPYVATIQNGNWQVIISALQSNSNVNVLSTPSVMVLNNHSAMISDGKNLGVTSGSYITNGGGGSSSSNPFNTVARTDFTLSLDVTPQVTGNLVQMKIQQKDTRLTDPSSTSANPESNDSQIKTSVLINSGSVLVLGGLVDDSTNYTVEKIPLLGDIPGIGRLFTYKEHSREKKNMMVFLHPVIVDSDEGDTDLTGNRYNLVRNLQLQWTDEDKANGAVLPGWQEKEMPALPAPFTEGEQNGG
jgi:general secretion pathway protein D